MVAGLSDAAIVIIVLDVRLSDAFSIWLGRLRDPMARTRIIMRVRRAQKGNLGDVRSVGDGVSEMRIDYGPGYRLYFVRRGSAIVILLCGGDKSTQARDIAEAKRLAQEN